MRRSLLPAFVVACFLSALLVAQSGFGHIHGVVRDASGQVLPGVQVTLSGASSFRRTSLTGETGEFWFRDIGPGTYSVTASLAGFNSARQDAIVSIGFTRELTFTLTVGSLSETVTVSGASPMAGQLMSSARVAGGIYPRQQPFNTEAYDKIDDNHWTEVSRRPLSTFSTDVDTASYANVRRFLNQGTAASQGCGADRGAH